MSFFDGLGTSLGNAFGRDQRLGGGLPGLIGMFSPHFADAYTKSAGFDPAQATAPVKSATPQQPPQLGLGAGPDPTNAMAVDALKKQGSGGGGGGAGPLGAAGGGSGGGGAGPLGAAAGAAGGPIGMVLNYLFGG